MKTHFSGLMAVPFVLLLLIPCSPAMPEDDNANSLFHSLFKRFRKGKYVDILHT